MSLPHYSSSTKAPSWTVASHLSTGVFASLLHLFNSQWKVPVSTCPLHCSSSQGSEKEMTLDPWWVDCLFGSCTHACRICTVRSVLWGQCCHFKQLIACDVTHTHSRWTSAVHMLWHRFDPDMNQISNLTGWVFFVFVFSAFYNNLSYVTSATLLS